jgi:Zn-finger protein
MSYKAWFDAHAAKHRSIVDKLLLEGYTQEKIIEYFRWENLKETDEDFCPLFAQDKKCHDTNDLNCYFCGCPNFRFDDNAPREKSSCSINSKNGEQIEFDGIIHQDCTNCLLPHKEKIIRKYFDTDWSKIMSEVVK